MATVTGARVTPGQQALGMTGAAAAVLFWGMGPVLFELADLGSLQFLFYRLWMGAGFMALVLLVSRRSLRWSLLRRALPGGVLLCADMALFFGALTRTSVTDATVIGVLQPALVLVVAGRWFGDRVGRRGVAWTGLAIAGAVVVVGGGGGINGHGLTGDALAFGSLLAWTGYWLVSKRVTAGTGPLEYTAGVMIVAAVAATPVVALSGELTSRVPRLSWLWVGLMVLVPGSGHILINWAHRFVDVSVSSVIGAANPVVAAASALAVLGEHLSAAQIVGGLVAVGAIAVVAGTSRSGHGQATGPGGRRLTGSRPAAAVPDVSAETELVPPCRSTAGSALTQ
ncbi:MAG: DMT family transporter [Acidimicrobiales bacterium]